MFLGEGCQVLGVQVGFPLLCPSGRGHFLI